jgi:hypothetical protein
VLEALGCLCITDVARSAPEIHREAIRRAFRLHVRSKTQTPIVVVGSQEARLQAKERMTAQLDLLENTRVSPELSPLFPPSRHGCPSNQIPNPHRADPFPVNGHRHHHFARHGPHPPPKHVQTPRHRPHHPLRNPHPPPTPSPSPPSLKTRHPRPPRRLRNFHQRPRRDSG